MADENENSCDKFDDVKLDKMFTLKKWNAVAMWSWDVECDTCAICRVQVMEQTIRNTSKSIWQHRQSCTIISKLTKCRSAMQMYQPR
ncbi:AGAP005562-PA-like protein [Anopheles sinensis]|uniref:AGAP005562-PA-like protein n=1 Tax=Anopheles sinensis TaxID=74873 RepID=A0A084WKM3_ANOSI|nr:AGAP005562-PA-like protein [Anopheles sinensis]